MLQRVRASLNASILTTSPYLFNHDTIWLAIPSNTYREISGLNAKPSRSRGTATAQCFRYRSSSL